MAECYAAFDAALSTVGSSAYELAGMGVPSILVPDVSPQKDEDFVAKAHRVLGDQGGFVVKAFDREGLAAAFAAMDDPRRLAAMTRDRIAQKPPNGAVNAATILMQQVSHLREDGPWRESS